MSDSKDIGGGFISEMHHDGSALKPIPYKMKDIRKKTLGRIGINGREKLKRLSQRHFKIIAMHLTGDYTGKEIAEELGVGKGTIYSVLNDPLAQEVIKEFRIGQMTELEALYPKAVEAIRTGLESGNVGIKLKAVDRYLKMAGIGTDEEKNIPSVSITINNAREHFVKVFKEMKDITPSVLLDGEDNA